MTGERKREKKREEEKERGRTSRATRRNEFFIKNGKPLIDTNDVFARGSDIELRFARISIFNDSRPCLRLAAVAMTIDRRSLSLPFFLSLSLFRRSFIMVGD